jgi:hypothetical protein
MKTNRIKDSILRMLAGAAIPTMTALAQPGPPPPAGGPLPPPPEANQAVETVQGTVSQYLMNPNGEVDGLLFADGTQVHFPPHMSADLTQAVKTNDNVNAQGVHENTAHFRAFTISDTVTGQSVNESRPSQFQRPMPPELRGIDLKPLQTEGAVKVVLVAPRGETDGVVLDNGTIIRVPPDIGSQYSAWLQIGQSIAANGYGTENQFGRCFQATAIGLSGQPLTPIYGAAGPAGGPPGVGGPAPTIRP